MVSVVLATYQELSNLVGLIPAIRSVLPEASIIIVDDGSPDGTPEYLRQLQEQDSRIVPIIRSGKLGYGTAVLEGFQKALELQSDFVLTLDADFSHDPKDLPRIREKLDSVDIAIGSRYVGGVRVLNWGPSRLLLSLFANRYVKSILGFPAEDATSGFRGYRKEALDAIIRNPPKSVGYSFLVETLFRLHRLGFIIGEVPIIYTERREGQSKMSKRVIFEAILRPWTLRMNRGFLPSKTRKSVTPPREQA